MTSNGIVSTQNGITVHLDPKRATHSGLAFVSHAHVDHLHNQNGGLLLTSRQTSEIAKIRGYQIQSYLEEYENYSLIDSGHILGAQGLLFGDDVFYTGDI